MDRPDITTRLSVNVNAIQQNYKLIRNRVSSTTRVAGVVKANAYGLGVSRVIPALEKAGCPLFFVATQSEAEIIRKISERPIAVMAAFMDADSADYFIHYRMYPVLNSMRDLEVWSEACKKRNSQNPAMLHIDTGMNRLGFNPSEMSHLLEEKQDILEQLNIVAILSHFARADEPETDFTNIQFARFSDIFRRMPDQIKQQADFSIANSFGVFNDKHNYNLTMVRPGRALYGLNPMPWQENPMNRVSKLEARVLKLSTALKGETIGYGGSYECQEPTDIATVSIGYADGLARSPKKPMSFAWQGIECPVLGRISMDLAVIGIGHIPQSQRPEAGDWVEIFGDTIDLETQAKKMGVTDYELLTGLGKRVHRHYTQEDVQGSKLHDRLPDIQYTFGCYAYK